jgi:hypothetical protein
MTSRRNHAADKHTKGAERIVEALVPSAYGSAFDTNAATITRLPAVIGSALRILRRYERGNTQGMRPRVLFGVYAGNRAHNGGIYIRTAERVRSPGKEEYDSAFRPEFPDRGTQCAIRRHAAEFCDDQREIEREYAPIHGATCDRFRPDVPTAAGLARLVCVDNQRDQQLF